MAARSLNFPHYSKLPRRKNTAETSAGGRRGFGSERGTSRRGEERVVEGHGRLKLVLSLGQRGSEEHPICDLQLILCMVTNGEFIWALVRFST